MKRKRYSLPKGAGSAPGFGGCSFCQGSGCLACKAESDRQYKAAFPEGPKPIARWEADYDRDLALMQDDGCPHVDIPATFNEASLPESPYRGLMLMVQRMLG